MAYNAINLPSLADAALLSVSLSNLDIAMVNFLLGGRTLHLDHLQGKAKMATAKSSLPSEYSKRLMYPLLLLSLASAVRWSLRLAASLAGQCLL